MIDSARQQRVLVLGAHGQIGRALVAAAPPGTIVRGLSHAELDIEVAGDIAAVLRTWRPDTVINAAGYTDVDAAERNPERAFAINCAAPAKLAAAAQLAGVQMVHLSSHFVFNGFARVPYLPTATTSPIGLYGASKAAGEHAVRAALPDALIVRTAWIYASQGQNFVLTMLKLMAGVANIRVVVDQVGTPTHARSFARGLWALVARGAQGTCHLTDGGSASWFDFAVVIGQMAMARGLLARAPVIVPIRTSDCETGAGRPAFSVLDCSTAWSQLGQTPPSWGTELGAMLDELRAIHLVKGSPA